MHDDEDEDPLPSSGVTSSVTQRDAHDVDSDVDRSGHDVPTVHNDPPFRRGEGSMLPEDGDSGRAAMPGAAGTEGFEPFESAGIHPLHRTSPLSAGSGLSAPSPGLAAGGPPGPHGARPGQVSRTHGAYGRANCATT